jgi:hypothetical protein
LQQGHVFSSPLGLQFENCCLRLSLFLGTQTCVPRL